MSGSTQTICECIVDQQDDGVRRQSGIFKAVVENAKEAFYTSKESRPLKDQPLFASSSEEESNDGAVVSCSAGDDVVAQKQILVQFSNLVDIKEMVNGKQFHRRKNKRGERQRKMIQRMSLRTLFRRIETRNPILFQTINLQGIVFSM